MYILPWTEIDNKESVDIMWDCWKSLFVQVFDKHAPLKTKTVRKRGNVPWIDKDVRTKLFERDFLKRKGIKTNEECDWNKYKSARNSANIALRHAKREYHTAKFEDFKTLGKQLFFYFLFFFEYKTVLRNDISKQKDYRSTIRTKINGT